MMCILIGVCVLLKLYFSYFLIVIHVADIAIELIFVFVHTRITVSIHISINIKIEAVSVRHALFGYTRQCHIL